MAKKPGVKIKRLPTPPAPDFEATPERIAQAGGANHMRLDDGTIERAGDRTPKCRRFVDSFVDRQRRAGRLTDAQWHAAEWYRERYEEAGIANRVVARYGGSTGAGETTYGLPTTERQARARQAWRKARGFIPPQMLGLVDRVVLQNDAPVFRNGQQGGRFVARLGEALTPLALWLSPSS